MFSNIKVSVVILLILAFVSAVPATQRMVLAEKYTNTGCGPCYQANLTMDMLADDHPDVMAVIRYHTSGPSQYDPFYLFNPSEHGVRGGYYNLTYVPYLRIDGIIEGGSSHSQYWSLISNRSEVESPVEIIIDGTFNEASRSGEINATVTATDNISLDGLFLRIALTESDIYFVAPNRLRYHHQTMRYMYPYSLGTRVYLSNINDVADVDVDFNIYDESIVLENCEIVAFLQSDQTKDILQAAKIPLSALERVSVDEHAELPKSFQLNQNYPNPFNAGTVIDYQLNQTGYVNLAIYDMLGRKIRTLVDNTQDAGRYQVKWNGVGDNGESVASGVYFYRLDSGDNSESRQMLLVK